MKIFLKYLLIFVVFTVILFLSFHSPILSFQKVLFYRGIGLLAITALSTLFIFILLRKKLNLRWETLLAGIIVSLAIHQSLFVTLPVTFDRSFSMYLLNRLDNVTTNNQCRGMKKTELEQSLIDEYFVGRHALDKRLAEQGAINFIENKNDCVYLTGKAKSFIRFTKVLQQIYGVFSL